jgi:Cytidine deaminase
MEKKLIIKYNEFDNREELCEKDNELLQCAINATSGSYAPYSNFNVGAALRMSNGEIISASNQENAAFPSGLCAERSAIFYAHSKYPDARIESIAIVAKEKGKLTAIPTPPCGSCRQVLSESQKRGGKPIKIILGSYGKILVFNSLEDILPFTFNNLDKV